MKKILSVLASSMLFVGSLHAANNIPPNTLNIPSSVVATSTFGSGSAIQNTNLPVDIKSQVVPSSASIVSDQLAQYQSAQLSAAQVQALKEIQEERLKNQVSPYTNIPLPAVRSISPDLSPGKTPPIVNVSKNMLTNIVFTDMSGNPWYIDKVLINRAHFNDNAGIDPNGKKTNVLSVEPVNPFEFGNVTVMLEGKTLPVIFMLASGQPSVDVRLDVRLAGSNPSAPNKSSYNPNDLMVSTDIDEVGLRFLDGNIPENAESLQSSDIQANAWRYGDYMYVKTRFDVLYPAYNSRATSPDGYNIYRFDNNPSSITFLQRNGQPITSLFTEMPYQYDR